MPLARFSLRALAVLGFVGLAASAARADVLITPFVGSNMGGSASSPLFRAIDDGSRTNFGVSLAAMAGGVFGVEADIGYTPRFVGADIDLAGVPISVAQNRVTTAMMNLTVGLPIQGRSGIGVRPYAVGGIGLIRQQIDVVGGLVSYTENDFGYDVGGGVVLFLGRHVGFRGDVRHFRTTGGISVSDLVDLEPGAFNFTRTSVGVTLRY
jgi:hypothetical protein